ncbi:hypothetical protein AKJ09_03942 [Labilithrix luteola]|uniref:Uncharacterized protein n=1 Tax=Labilithrix luteola TaxID=1391654 RepID=A0A0K1PUS3_9BACT|nr:hypothetical protein [Labilithrix luteola]AKU97278.1 hypothetical protein AKJ09_03942 [Labilithrix luteola]
MTKKGKKKGLEKAIVAQPVRVPYGALFRMFLLGSVAVVAAIYAIWRHYTVPHVPMLVPVTAPTEIPAPDLDPAPAPSH